MSRAFLKSGLLSACWLSALPANGFVVTFFEGSSYDADSGVMDTALGISGYTIEDFEDTSLVPGLSIGYTNPNAGPVATLPTVYNEAAIGNYTNNLWDGAHALVNTPQNQEWNQPGIGLSSLTDRITFFIDGGSSSFGLGLSNFQSDLVDHEFLVNGTPLIPALEALTGWTPGISVRNGYIRIDAESGESIDSISIDIGTGQRDGLVMDRLAFTPIPEPSAGVVALLGLGLGLRRRRIV